MRIIERMTLEQRAGTIFAGLAGVSFCIVLAASYAVGSMHELGGRAVDGQRSAFEMILRADRDLHRAQRSLDLVVDSESSTERRAFYGEYAFHVLNAVDALSEAGTLVADNEIALRLIRSAHRQQQRWSTSARELTAEIERERYGLDARRTLAAETAILFAALGQAVSYAAESGFVPRGGEHRRRLDEQLETSLLIVWGSLTTGLLIGFLGLLASLKHVRANMLNHVQEAEYRDFDRRLRRALQLVETEPDVLDVVNGALSHVLGEDRRAELLLGEAVRSDLTRALATRHAEEWRGCSVRAPNDCPAVRRNMRMVFDDNSGFDACAYLKNRAGQPCSAVCIPVSILGQPAGVLHALGPQHSLPERIELRKLTTVALQTGHEIGLVRAFSSKDKQANTDKLTGLANRRSLEARIPALFESGEVFSVAYGDLDRFKILNDAHGHDAGDRALRLFAEVLKSTLRPTDLFARWGGEEFVVVLRGSGRFESVNVLDRIRGKLEERLAGASVPKFTVSFGVSDSSMATSFDTTLHRADEALRRAKQEGRDKVVCDAVDSSEDAVVRDDVFVDEALRGP